MIRKKNKKVKWIVEFNKKSFLCWMMELNKALVPSPQPPPFEKATTRVLADLQ
jgi:hypothetical protein